MATEYSRPGYLVFNGSALTEVSQVTMRDASNDKPVHTLLKGLAGFSDGPEEVFIDFESAIPRPGMEQPYASFVRGHRTVTMGFRIANELAVCEGRFMERRVTTDVNAPNQVGLQFHGKVISATLVPTA